MKYESKASLIQCLEQKNVVFQIMLYIIILALIFDILREFHVSVFYVTNHVQYDLPCDDVSLSVSEDLDMLNNVVNVTRRNRVNFCSFRNLSLVVDKVAERNARILLSRGLSKKSLSCGNRSAAKPIVNSLAYFSVLATQPNTSKGNHPNRSLSCGNSLLAEPNHLALAHFTEIRSRIKGEYFGTVLDWSDSSTSSFIGKELKYVNGRLRVNSTNFYFIYLSLTFRQGSKVIDEKLKQGFRERLMTFRASILKRTGLYERAVAIPFLDYVETVCDRNTDNATMRLASHAFLNRHDEIFVKLTDADRLVLQSPGNQFGIFKLR